MPDAGSILQQLEREKIKQIPKPAIKEEEKKSTTSPSHSQVSVLIKSVTFNGNTIISNNQLNLIVKPYINQTLNFSDIQDMVTKVANFYRESGWLAKVYLPEQNLSEGNITIEIKEGKFSAIEINGESKRVQKDFISNRILKQVPLGNLVNIKSIDRGVLLVNDLPGVKVSGSFAPGNESSESNLILNVADEPLIEGAIISDNHGPKSTGVARATANLNINSPFKFGDQLSVMLQKTEGIDYVSGAYSFPVGNDGLRTSFSASHLDYEIVSPSLKSLNAHGHSNNYGAQIFYPWHRSKYKNLYMIASLDHRDLYNSASNVVQSDYAVNVAQINLLGNQYDAVLAGAFSQGSIALFNGNVDLSGSPNKSSVQQTTKAINHFAKLRFSLNREQFIQPSWSLYGSLQGQIASTNLDGSEKFYLGGPQGVRAYPVNEGSGSHGSLVNLEWRYYFSPNVTVKTFYDYGWARVNVNNSFVGAPSLNEYSMKGAGLSLQYRFNLGPSIDITYSRRIGDNPNATATGNDQDGTKISDRVWINASIPF
jgi:hemolysin activation/secretion protein